ncbi:MAG: outer membrane protein [bacterium P3]|nr:MAG: outer membrane protein [bacterium P3]KWW41027.1 MAG: outer membrane protein [bacterium F083]
MPYNRLHPVFYSKPAAGLSFLLSFLFVSLCCSPLRAQVRVGGSDHNIDYLTPKSYEIGDIVLEGADRLDKRMVILVSGLQVGETVRVPGDRIATAIDNLWKQGLFEDIQIRIMRIQDGKIYLKIFLKERPKLARFKFNGVKKSDADKLRTEIKLVAGDVVTENLLTTSRNKILSYYKEKGYGNVSVQADAVPDTAGGKADRVDVIFNVKVGKKVKIDTLVIEGNSVVSTNKLLRKMKNTHDVRYGRKLYFWTPGFWKKSRYDESKLQEDLDGLVAYYNSMGYRDARVVSDTVYDSPANGASRKQDRLIVRVKLHEGNKYTFRNITFTGNTIYSSETLSRHLRIKKGDPYNEEQLMTNISYNPSGTDITALYMDNGYLFFNATPVEVAVDNDSIDIEIRIVEGKQARIRNVTVEGNTITNDKIIMRELHTRPGDLFSRDAVLRSRRELATLGYFKEESIIPEPRPNREDGTVDIVYKVEEGSTSQINLQGGYGSGMVIGQLGLQLNNFSARNIFNKNAWAPLPAGDGQKLGLNLVTNGTYYYAISGSFTEPWLGGRRPQSLTVSLYHNLYSNGYYYSSSDERYYSLRITGGGVSFSRRLKWPDDYFIFSQGLSYKRYTLNNYTNLSSLFTDGASNDLSYSVTVSRNSLDSPIFPRSGSEVSVSGFVTPPYSLFRHKGYYSSLAAAGNYAEMYKWIEYFKVNVRGSWMLNLVGDVVLNARFRFGWMSYYNSEIGLSPFGRYYLGGDGLSTWMLDGREVIPLRGYQNNSLTPSGGASVFDRYTFELRQPVIESNSATIYVLGFLEGGNSWASTKQFQPFKMYNSAGLGVRVFMPMFGMIGIDWGYGFDGLYGGSQFHFSIGQSLD